MVFLPVQFEPHESRALDGTLGDPAGERPQRRPVHQRHVRLENQLRRELAPTHRALIVALPWRKMAKIFRSVCVVKCWNFLALAGSVKWCASLLCDLAWVPWTPLTLETHTSVCNALFHDAMWRISLGNLT